MSYRYWLHQKTDFRLGVEDVVAPDIRDDPKFPAYCETVYKFIKKHGGEATFGMFTRAGFDAYRLDLALGDLKAEQRVEVVQKGDYSRIRAK